MIVTHVARRSQNWIFFFVLGDEEAISGRVMRPGQHSSPTGASIRLPTCAWEDDEDAAYNPDDFYNGGYGSLDDDDDYGSFEDEYEPDEFDDDEEFLEEEDDMDYDEDYDDEEDFDEFDEDEDEDEEFDMEEEDEEEEEEY